jgi:membrane-associated phospholipid phosphatase
MAFMAAVCAVQALYFPINRGMSGGVALTTPLDTYIPLIPIWVAPYALAWGLWITCAAWAALRMEEALYRSLLISIAVVLAGGLACFLLYPTYVQRPALEGEGWAVEWLRFIYANDRVYNAFPSGHVYITTLIALYWSRWYPRQRAVWLAVVVIVALSTLFTGQHYLLDPLGGLALAWGGYHVGLWLTSAPRADALQPV